jgi:hypothetical protein
LQPGNSIQTVSRILSSLPAPKKKKKKKVAEPEPDADPDSPGKAKKKKKKKKAKKSDLPEFPPLKYGEPMTCEQAYEQT